MSVVGVASTSNGNGLSYGPGAAVQTGSTGFASASQNANQNQQSSSPTGYGRDNVALSQANAYGSPHKEFPLILPPDAQPAAAASATAPLDTRPLRISNNESLVIAAMAAGVGGTAILLHVLWSISGRQQRADAKAFMENQSERIEKLQKGQGVDDVLNSYLSEIKSKFSDTLAQSVGNAAANPEHAKLFTDAARRIAEPAATELSAAQQAGLSAAEQAAEKARAHAGEGNGLVAAGDPVVYNARKVVFEQLQKLATPDEKSPAPIHLVESQAKQFLTGAGSADAHAAWQAHYRQLDTPDRKKHARFVGEVIDPIIKQHAALHLVRA